MDNTQNAQDSKPRKTWFIERTGDGFIFATDEIDAWNLLTDKSTWRRHDFKIIGVSNGETYFKILKTGNAELATLQEERAAISRDLQKYLQTEDRLRFTELKDDSDEMVIKVKGLIADLNKKLEEVDNKIQNFNSLIVKKAFDAELEIAKGTIEFPSNQNVISPVESDKKKILQLLENR